MSFGAMAGWQALLLVAAAGAVAAWLFYLKVRPPRIAVPSLLLWRRVLDQKRELTLWERIRKAVSLAATIFVAIALALAVTRPGPVVAGGSRGRVLIVVDSSWSMLAGTPDGGTRWDRAIGLARQLAAAAGGEDVALATTADGLVEGPTSDLALVETAIGELQPSGGEDAAWPQVGGAAEVHFLTDGAVARPVGPGVVIHSVYEPADNVAITAFEVRRAPMPDSRGEAYLEVANYSASPQQVRVVVTRGTQVISEGPIEMGAGEAIRQTMPIGPGEPRLRARVSAPANALAIDDEAVAWVEGAEPLTVTVVSADPGALGLLLQRHPGVRARFIAPGKYDAGDADVLVFDRWVPDTPPGRPSLIVMPPTTAWLGTRGAEERNVAWTSVPAHPVLAGVDPHTLDITRAVAFEGPALQPIARSLAGTPLVAIADEADQRFVVLGVGLADSNLSFSPAFPVLIGNALEWLGRPPLDSLARPGPVSLPASTSRVTGPSGAPLTLLDAGEHKVARLRDPGLYLVEVGGARSVIGVNVGGPDVSNLARTNLAESVVLAGAGDVGAGHIWWLYAVALAFVLIAAEWWTWQRRITV
jgi:hypothetical protein